MLVGLGSGLNPTTIKFQKNSVFGPENFFSVEVMLFGKNYKFSEDFDCLVSELYPGLNPTNIKLQKKLVFGPENFFSVEVMLFDKNYNFFRRF